MERTLEFRTHTEKKGLIAITSHFFYSWFSHSIYSWTGTWRGTHTYYSWTQPQYITYTTDIYMTVMYTLSNTVSSFRYYRYYRSTYVFYVRKNISPVPRKSFFFISLKSCDCVILFSPFSFRWFSSYFNVFIRKR